MNYILGYLGIEINSSCNCEDKLLLTKYTKQCYCEHGEVVQWPSFLPSGLGGLPLIPNDTSIILFLMRKVPILG